MSSLADKRVSGVLEKKPQAGGWEGDSGERKVHPGLQVWNNAQRPDQKDTQRPENEALSKDVKEDVYPCISAQSRVFNLPIWNVEITLHVVLRQLEFQVEKANLDPAYILAKWVIGPKAL